MHNSDNHGLRCVTLLSGGLDSATATAIARRDCDHVTALSFDYGQRHAIELDRAMVVGRDIGVDDHVVVSLHGVFSSSALTCDKPVPRHDPNFHGIPDTYVPGRNLVFLSCAVAMCESIGGQRVYVGVNAVDYSGYPDCRPEFVQSFQQCCDLALKCSVLGNLVSIECPLINLSKREIKDLAGSLGVNIDATHSCYSPLSDGSACGVCDSCVIRNG